MKRREFIINSALAVGGTALLAGCGEKKIIKSENQVARRKYKDIEVPLLALGCMRLPMKGDEVDMQELERMESRNGIHTVETAAALGLGNHEYEIIKL